MKPGLSNNKNTLDSDLDVLELQAVVEQAMIDRNKLSKSQAKARVLASTNRILELQNPTQGLDVHDTLREVN